MKKKRSIALQRPKAVSCTENVEKTFMCQVNVHNIMGVLSPLLGLAVSFSSKYSLWSFLHYQADKRKRFFVGGGNFKCLIVKDYIRWEDVKNKYFVVVQPLIRGGGRGQTTKGLFLSKVFRIGIYTIFISLSPPLTVDTLFYYFMTDNKYCKVLGQFLFLVPFLE